MEGIVPIAIWISLGLVALGLLVIVGFGIKSLVSGKHRVMSIGAMVLPLIVFGICYAITSGGPDPMAAAMILTALVLLGAGLIAIVVTGLKSFVGF